MYVTVCDLEKSFTFDKMFKSLPAAAVDAPVGGDPIGVVIVEGEGAVLGVNLGSPIVTNGAFVTRSCQITLRTCSLCVHCIATDCLQT